MTFVITSSARSAVGKEKQNNNAEKRMVCTLALVVSVEEMKFVLWLALSPVERVRESASLANSDVPRALAAASSFLEKAAR